MSDVQGVSTRTLTMIGAEEGTTFRVGGCVYAQVLEREVTGDGGLTALLLVKQPDESMLEAIRLDLFRTRPHGHLNGGAAELNVDIWPNETRPQTLVRMLQPESADKLLRAAGFFADAEEVSDGDWTDLCGNIARHLSA